VRRELCLAYDVVGVASDAFLGYLREWLGPDSPPLLPLHQATDPDRFYPQAGAPAHKLLFVGSARDGRRPIIDDLAGTPYDLAVYGRKWTGSSLDPSHLRGDWIANDRLHQYYASAAIVLSDTWADMRDEGFVANRVYDVLASGGFVISDDVAGIDTEFDGAVPVYHDRDELWRLIETYLADPAGRATLAERGRRIVIDRHTFYARVDAILAAIEGLPGSRRT
jgi:spore maturation protein CgeB